MLKRPVLPAVVWLPANSGVVMDCKEFRDVSESYLNDELLVETNHSIGQHVADCTSCRIDFAARRALRNQMVSAVARSDAFEVDPVFSNRLEARLKAEALKLSSWQKFFVRVMVPVMALLVVAVGFGVYYLSTAGGRRNVADISIGQGLTEIAHIVSGDHRHCGLARLEQWEAMAARDYPRKEEFTEKMLRPIKADFSSDVEMLSVHDCQFEGKQFTHVVLKRGQRVVSLFLDRADGLPEQDGGAESAIISALSDGLQVASFVKNARNIFVVSDMSEEENLKLARVLSKT